jgi:hypothetical protein
VTDSDSIYRTIWRAIRSPEPHPALRVTLSIVSALLLLAVAMFAAWAYARTTTRGYAREEHVAVAIIVAAVAWIGALFFLWAPVRRGRGFAMALFTTLAIAVATIGGMILVEETVRRDEEFLMTTVFLLGLALAILAWLPVFMRLSRGRPVVGPDDLVQVNCPGCDYSLIGLRDLRCPECGLEFTIDELIRAQNYAQPPEPPATDV